MAKMGRKPAKTRRKRLSRREKQSGRSGWRTAAAVLTPAVRLYAPAPPSTVTARRFWDQQEMSLHTATGRSLP